MTKADFKPASGTIPNIDERLTPGERSFRKLLLTQIIHAGQPVRPEALAEPAALSLSEVETLIAALQTKGLLVRDASGAIAFVYPVSALPTSHRVILADGSAFFAMCAIDSLGCAFEFDQDATVTSVCSQCRKELTVHLKAGKVDSSLPQGIHALHVNLGNYVDWAASC